MSAEPANPDGDEGAVRELRHQARTAPPLSDAE